ncbi:MAG: hypothetical protein HN348_21205, partial [Proteobacteria bacterium]|nr:hypothetical protein [Pseudomonadota bacterium]
MLNRFAAGLFIVGVLQGTALAGGYPVNGDFEGSTTWGDESTYDGSTAITTATSYSSSHSMHCDGDQDSPAIAESPDAWVTHHTLSWYYRTTSSHSRPTIELEDRNDNEHYSWGLSTTGGSWTYGSRDVSSKCGFEVKVDLIGKSDKIVANYDTYWDDVRFTGTVCAVFDDTDDDGFCQYGVDYNDSGDCTDVGEITGLQDCNDASSELHPNQVWYGDCDGDGYHRSAGSTSCNPPNVCNDGQSPDGGWSHSAPGQADCNDENTSLHPNQTWYPDCDGDGYYVATSTVSCDQPSGSGICSDNLTPDGGFSNSSPGLNYDCDDEDITNHQAYDWYPDCDGDGKFSGTAVAACTQPSGAGVCNDNQAPNGGWTNTNPTTNADCNDEDSGTYQVLSWYPDCEGDGVHSATGVSNCGQPDPTGVCGDNQNPDGGWDTTPPGTGDCNDEDPASQYILSWYPDCDGDSFDANNPTASCGQPGTTPCNDSQAPDGGWTSSASTFDCNDENATEQPDQTWYPDCDNDGWYDDTATVSCVTPASGAGICNDNQLPDGGWANTHPVAADCDDEDSVVTAGTDWYPDCDDDGHPHSGAINSCGQPDPNGICDDNQIPDGGWASSAPAEGDCDDEDDLVYPEQPWYPDCDGDNWHSDSVILHCDTPATPCLDTQIPNGGWEHTIVGSADCKDEDANQFPNQVWYPDCDHDNFFGALAATQCDEPANPGCNDGLSPDGGFSHIDPAGNIDCDDNDAQEIPGQTWYADCDGDGYHRSTAVQACEQPTGAGLCSDNLAPDGGWQTDAPGEPDCNDEDAQILPSVSWYPDCDGDGFFDDGEIVACGSPDPQNVCDDHQEPDGGWSNADPAGNADCNDENGDAFPNQVWYTDCDDDGAYDITGHSSCDEPNDVCNDHQSPNGG